MEGTSTRTRCKRNITSQQGESRLTVSEGSFIERKEKRREHSVILKCYRVETEEDFHTNWNMDLVAKVFHSSQEHSKMRKQKELYAGSCGTAAGINNQVLQHGPAFCTSPQ